MAANGIAFLCLCLLVGACVATPSIPTTFYAKVRATLISGSNHQNKDSWVGGGIYALDAHTGYQRIHLTLDAEYFEQPEQINYHYLARYDMQKAYSIAYSRECTSTVVTGELESPFKWVQNATFTGESEYMGFKIETWEYTDASKAHYKISVKKGTNEPVIFTTGHQIVTDETAMLEMTVLEWHTRIAPEIRSYIPTTCLGASTLQGTVAESVQFANANWNCADPACSSTVAAGDPQPNYGCAEFVARSLAAGGFIPGLGPLDPQGSFGGWSYQGNTYDLLWCSNLSDALSVLGFTKMANQASSVSAGCAAFGDGGDGYFSHAVFGVNPGIDDAHNNARLQYQVADSLFGGIDAVWCPPGSSSTGSTVGTGGTVSSTSSSYYSVLYEEEIKPFSLGGMKNVKVKGTEKVSREVDTRGNLEVDNVPVSTDMRVVEERADRKFE